MMRKLKKVMVCLSIGVIIAAVINIPVIAKNDSVVRVEDKGNYEILWMSEGYQIGGYYEEILFIEKDGKTGWMDKKGNLIVSPKYDDISICNDGLLSVILNGKYGLVSVTGREITPFIYSYIDPLVEGYLIPVQKDGKWGCIDIDGNTIIPIQYDEIDASYDTGLKVNKGDKYGWLDIKGKEIIPLIYDEISKYNNYYEVTKNGKSGLIDSTGKLILPIIYEGCSAVKDHELICIKRNGKYGFIDFNEREVIPCIYDTYLECITEGIVLIKNEKCVLVDFKGKEVIPFIYDEFLPFSRGVAAVKKDGKCGFIDKTGKNVIPCRYDAVDSFNYGLAAVCIDNKWGCIDLSGKEIVKPTYDNLCIIHNMMLVNKNGKWGYLDKTGKVTIPIIYDNMNFFADGLYWVEKNEKCGYVDYKGNEVIPVTYDALSLINEGTILGEKDGKMGVFDTSGRLRIPFIYDDLGGFKRGVTTATKDAKTGAIDLNGKEIVPIQYDYIGILGAYYAGWEFDDQMVSIGYNGMGGAMEKKSFCSKWANAVPISTTVNINGVERLFSAYTIEGKSYYKLRDIASVLNGTEKNFNVSWNSEKQAVAILTGEDCQTLEEKFYNSKKNEMAFYCDHEITIDGVKFAFPYTYFTVNGSTYVDLYQVADMLDFDYYWDGNTNTYVIDTASVLVHDSYETAYRLFGDKK